MLKSLRHRLMRYIEVLDRRLGFARDLVDEVLGHAFVALVCFLL